MKFVEKKYRSMKSKCGCPAALDIKEQLLLVLSRLRVGLLEQDLAYRFNISLSAVSTLFTFWVDFVHSLLTALPIWPSKDIVNRFMPDAFPEIYLKTRVIVDCTELFTETPSDYLVQSDTYSSYKSHNTAKGLIGITPNGFIPFVADLSPGSLR